MVEPADDRMVYATGPVPRGSRRSSKKSYVGVLCFSIVYRKSRRSERIIALDGLGRLRLLVVTRPSTGYKLSIAEN